MEHLAIENWIEAPVLMVRGWTQLELAESKQKLGMHQFLMTGSLLIGCVFFQVALE